MSISERSRYDLCPARGAARDPTKQRGTCGASGAPQMRDRAMRRVCAVPGLQRITCADRVESHQGGRAALRPGHDAARPRHDAAPAGRMSISDIRAQLSRMSPGSRPGSCGLRPVSRTRCSARHGSSQKQISRAASGLRCRTVARRAAAGSFGWAWLAIHRRRRRAQEWRVPPRATTRAEPKRP